MIYFVFLLTFLMGVSGGMFVLSQAIKCVHVCLTAIRNHRNTDIGPFDTLSLARLVGLHPAPWLLLLTAILLFLLVPAIDRPALTWFLRGLVIAPVVVTCIAIYAWLRFRRGDLPK